MSAKTGQLPSSSGLSVQGRSKGRGGKSKGKGTANNGTSSPVKEGGAIVGGDQQRGSFKVSVVGLAQCFQLSEKRERS